MTTCSLNSLKLFRLERVRCLSLAGTSYLATVLMLLVSIFCWASVFSYLLAYILHFDFKDFSFPLKHAKLQGERLNLISCCNFLGILSSSIFSAVKPDPFFIILLLTPSNCAWGRSHIFIFYWIIYLASSAKFEKEIRWSLSKNDVLAWIPAQSFQLHQYGFVHSRWSANVNSGSFILLHLPN